MRVSLELLPRSEEHLRRQLEELCSLSRVDTVNLPDIARFPLRAWQACGPVAEHSRKAIPHLRAIDTDLDRPLRAAQHLVETGVDEVLVVAGDAPADMSRPVYPTTSLQLIRALRKTYPQLTVYAAYDPYRQGLQAEHAYALEKLDAGAVGLFTQPFFDLRLMEIVAETLDGIDVFWGVTSVTSSRSQRYWENRNRIFFPASFEPTMEWNRWFAGQAVDFVRGSGGNIYFMPIRAGISEYLGGIL